MLRLSTSTVIRLEDDKMIRGREMKRYENILEGEVEDISMTEFRKHPGAIIDQVQMGKVFNITRNNKIVVVLSAPEPSATELGAVLRHIGEGKSVY